MIFLAECVTVRGCTQYFVPKDADHIFVTKLALFYYNEQQCIRYAVLLIVLFNYCSSEQNISNFKLKPKLV